MRKIGAVSGGKDSTALALRLQEVEPADYEYVITPTGDELPTMLPHWDKLQELLNKQWTFVRAPGGRTLNDYIREFDSLPTRQMRWCTKLLKIKPFEKYIQSLHCTPGEVTVYVGLRADELDRKGMTCDANQRFPLREWGWGLDEVLQYLKERNIEIPRRTDCARCFNQRIGEWWLLWKEYPEIYASAEAQEVQTGYTFRKPGQDTWPQDLSDLRWCFERGHRPVDRGPRRKRKVNA